MHQRACNHQAPFHATRQASCLRFAMLPEAKLFQVMFGLLGCNACRDAIETGLVGNDLLHRFEGIEIKLLWH